LFGTAELLFVHHGQHSRICSFLYIVGATGKNYFGEEKKYDKSNLVFIIVKITNSTRQNPAEINTAKKADGYFS
jgi:hypothetical protein